MGYQAVDEKVLEMMQETLHLSRKITQPVDPHKRYHAGDKDDPHTQLINFVYETGAALFRDRKA